MSFIEGKNIGILGGGQLAKMLAASAQKMGANVHIFSESKSDPAAAITAFHTLGSLKNLHLKSLSSKIEKWARDLDVVTFESEFLELSKLKLKSHAPNTKAMMILRDRLSQKSLLQDFKIPTSPFNQSTNSSQFIKPCVLKQRLFGYDGYGTFVCKDESSYLKFKKTKPKFEDWIQEDFIAFKRELAFSIVRTKDNNFTMLPLVETFQKDSKCFWVKGPVENKNLAKILPKVKKMLSHLNYVGIIAFELFETKTGEILVNEVAPRVHNSAHYSIEGLPLSQFDLHILSLFNQKLPKQISPHKAFAMVNLIGSKKSKAKLTCTTKGALHWYGKLDNRPGRKMGHITCLDKTPQAALKSVLKAEKEQNL